jgi:hypothetical protein
VVYGVGAGDSPPAGDGEGASVEPSVFGGVFFLALCRVGVGVGEAAVTAGAVVVALVPDCSHEVTNAVPIKAVSKHNRYFFISLSSTPAECLVA